MAAPRQTRSRTAPEEAIRAAVKDYYDRKGVAYNAEDFVFPEEDEAGHVAEHC